MQQMCLILTDLIRTQLIGRFAEVTCEALDCAEVAAYSGCRVVTTLEFLQHHFAKLGHRDLLVTHTLLPISAEQSSLYATRSVRRASGFVVCWACSAAWR